MYLQGDPGHGIGGYDLLSPNDRAFAFDYTHCGRLDHIVLYRAGAGMIWILSNNGGVFQPVFQSFHGIGGYDLLSPFDLAFAYDYDSASFYIVQEQVPFSL